jgi:HPt (histidine-containing phosphotransfer) domain-containing protein
VIESSSERPKNAAAEDGNPGEPPLDRAAVLQRVGGDRELLAELAEVFRKHYPTQLTELQEAITAGDPGRVEHLGHSLKGALNNLGAGPASKSAMRLEEMGRNANLAAAGAERVALEREIARAEKELTLLCHEVER